MGDLPEFPEYKRKMQDFDQHAANDPFGFLSKQWQRASTALFLSIGAIIIFVLSYFIDRTEHGSAALINLALAAVFAVILVFDIRKMINLGRFQWMIIEEFDRLREEGHLDPVAAFRSQGGLAGFRKRVEAEHAEDEAIERAKLTTKDTGAHTGSHDQS